MKYFKRIHDKPVIGVAAIMCDKDSLGDYALPTTYTKSIEGSGARVVPIFPNQPVEYYRKLFLRLNGLLVPGGYGAPLTNQKPITDMVKLFYDWSIESYNNKEKPVYWPIWGTCLGFEILATISCGMIDCLDRNELCNTSRCLDLKAGSEESRLIKDMPAELVKVCNVQKIYSKPRNVSLLIIL